MWLTCRASGEPMLTEVTPIADRRIQVCIQQPLHKGASLLIMDI